MNSASAYALLRSSQISPARASSASAPRLPDADRQVSPPCGQIGDLPVPGRNVYRHARVSDLAGLQRHSRKRAEACCLPPSKNASAPETRIHSRLNGWPVDTPVNASRYASRRTAHDSGTTWIATPLLARTFTPDTPPVSPAHLIRSHWRTIPLATPDALPENRSHCRRTVRHRQGQVADRLRQPSRNAPFSLPFQNRHRS